MSAAVCFTGIKLLAAILEEVDFSLRSLIIIKEAQVIIRMDALKFLSTDESKMKPDQLAVYRNRLLATE